MGSLWFGMNLPFDEDGIPDGLVWVFGIGSGYHLPVFCAGISLRMYSSIYIVLYLLSSQDRVLILLSGKMNRYLM